MSAEFARGLKQTATLIYNTMKAPHRYNAQVSDTTMLTRAVLSPDNN